MDEPAQIKKTKSKVLLLTLVLILAVSVFVLAFVFFGKSTSSQQPKYISNAKSQVSPSAEAFNKAFNIIASCGQQAGISMKVNLSSPESKEIQVDYSQDSDFAKPQFVLIPSGEQSAEIKVTNVSNKKPIFFVKLGASDGSKTNWSQAKKVQLICP